MTEPQITYSDRLRKARIERGLRQVELAQLLDISSSTVSVIENGHQAPSFPLVVRWAGACEVSLDWVARGLDGDWPGRSELLRSFGGELDAATVDQLDAVRS